MNNLSETQLRFYHLIKPYPRLAALWDWNKRDVDLKALESREDEQDAPLSAYR